MRWVALGAMVFASCYRDSSSPGDDLKWAPIDATLVWPDEGVPDASEPQDMRPCPGPPDLPLAPARAPLPLDAPAFYPALYPGRSLAIGDVNGDGVPDLVAPDLIRVLPGRRGGGFGAPIDTNTALFSWDGALADLDGDGRLDVIAGEEDLNPGDLKYYIATYRGNGDGTFAGRWSYEVPFHGPSQFVAADFDGDGKRDILWRDSRRGAGLVHVLLGNGDGSLRAPAGAPLKDDLMSVAAADLDRDGRADLVATSGADGRVAVYLGRGDGSFQAPSLYGSKAPYFDAWPVTIADLDGDGKLDVLAGLAPGTLTILPGRGDGTFDAPRTTPTLDGSGAIVVADTDGDGQSDVVVTGDGWSIAVAFHRGLGGFALGPPVLRVAGDYPSYAAAADFDGDGRADVALRGALGVAILPGTADGAPHTTADQLVAPSPNDLALADLDGDGKLDLVITASGTYDANEMPHGQGTYLYRGRGDGTFDAGRLLDGAQAGFVFARDFDRDGTLDLAFTVKGAVRVMRGNGDGTFKTAADTPTPDSADALAIGDLDEDGNLDLVGVGYSAGNMTILRGRGNGLFDLSSLPVDGGPWSLAIGDFDGDQHADVALGVGDYHNSMGSLVVLRGDGKNGFAPPEPVEPDASILALAAADLDGDRQDELVILRNGYPAPSAVARRACDGTWQLVDLPRLDRGSRALAVADLDSDGRLDLLVPQPGIPCIDRCTTYGLAVLLSRGGTTFGEATRYPTGLEPWALAVGDVDGDGRPDVLVANSGETVTVLRNKMP